jgi:hypothetical protein
MGTRLVRGRDFTDADREGAPGVAVVNETLAATLWPGEDPLGKRLSFEGPGGPFLEVVGVARDAKFGSLSEPDAPFVFFPTAQEWTSTQNLLVRTTGDPAHLAGAMRAAVLALDPDQPVYDVRPLGRIVDRALADPGGGSW